MAETVAVEPLSEKKDDQVESSRDDLIRGAGDSDVYNNHLEVPAPSPTLAVSTSDKDTGLYTDIVSNSPAEQSRDSYIKRGIKRARELEPMDHSGLENDRKIPCVLLRVGAKQCLSPPPLDELQLLSDKDCGKELARCLEESKVYLVIDVVKCLGVEKTYELFTETSAIQKDGGQISADGNYKKSPGGVFLSLVKKKASKEQKEIIFKTDSTNKRFKKKERRQRLQRKLESRQLELEKREKEWKIEALRVEQDAKCEQVNDELKHIERNIHKRLPGNSIVDVTGQNEAMECEGSICRNKSAQMQQLSTESGNSTQKKGNSTHVHREILAAEEFDRTSDCTLDFDLHID